LYPAWVAARASVADTLKEASNNSSASTGGVRVRKAIVCAQVAFSALLLIPMGLFLKSLVNLVRVDLGIRTENLVTFSVSPDLNGYTPERIQSLYTQMEERLAAIPGMQSATVSMVPLISGSNWGNSLLVEGYRQDPDADSHSMFNSVGPGFFGKMGIPLMQGREFTDADTMASQRVAVVNESWAKHFFPNGNAIGRTFKEGDPDSPLVYVVGIAKDTKYSSVREKIGRVYYTAYRQNRRIGSVAFYVRSALPAEQAVNQVRRVMREIDSDLPLENLRTMQEQVRHNVRSDRMVLTLASAFAILATSLSMLGLYGVMAYGVVRRTREIGIRMALGAASDSIRQLVLREVGMILGIGLVIGVPAAVGLARLTESQLFGVKSFDLAVVAGAMAALAASSFLAGFLPAWRASRIKPIQALRYE
jgi:predicted permease